jgi:nucleotide-binding universal stress UspA family protein
MRDLWLLRVDLHQGSPGSFVLGVLETRIAEKRSPFMAYKSLLTIISDPGAVAPTLAAAISLARRDDAHLEVLCMGFDQTQVGYYYPGMGAVFHQHDIALAEAEVAALESAVKARLNTEGLRFSVETAIAQVGGLADLIGRHARFSDLVVLPIPYGKHRFRYADVLVEAVLFQGRTPVLVVPSTGLPEVLGTPTLGQEIVVAWNDSAEALVAIHAALPLLRAAKNVTIAIVDPSSQSADRSDPGGALSQMLARHGVHVEVAVLAKTLPRVTDVLKQTLRDKAADLLVMGAYGHSRFREAMLGGATRDMLEVADVPVFMAH